MKKQYLLITILFCVFSYSQNFHDTQGKLEVSNSGQATFTLPIALPPSISSIGPTINLVYASGQNDGIAGQGWNLSNLSSISRIGTRLDIDGFKDGVDFDDNDKLALDGQRLLQKSGATYWSDGSIYETEVQSNTKIQLVGSGAAIYFIVTSPDGSRSWYGNYGGMNATDLSAYYIVRYEDANGNFMLYNYSKPLNKSLCIDTIQFSANTNGNTTPLNYIKFGYTTASRTERAYFKSVLIEKLELLNNIKVFTNSLPFKEYVLTHITDSQLGYQRVATIQEFNGAGEAANPIEFLYKENDDIVVEKTRPYTDSYDFSEGIKLTGDFDGDGRMDFYAGTKIYTKLFGDEDVNYNFTTPNLFGGIFTAKTIYNGKINQSQSIVNVTNNLNSTVFNYFNIINGVVIPTGNKSFSMDNAVKCFDQCPSDKICYSIGEDGHQIVVPCNANCPNPATVKNSNSVMEGDFNGDSISDVLVFSYNETRTYAPSQVNNPISEKGEAPTNQCYWTIVRDKNFNGLRLIDLNPNVSSAENSPGNVNLMGYSNLLQDCKLYIMDFNSDGKSDILSIDKQKHYYVLSFKQLSVAPWVQLEIIGEGTLDSYDKDKTILFGDYNADGKPDVMIPVADGSCIPEPANGPTPAVICPNSSMWNIYYSNPNPAGGAFFTKQSYDITDYIKVRGDDVNNYYALDINKDGKTDIVKTSVGVYSTGAFFDPTDFDSRWRVSSFINNIGNNNGSSNFIANYTSGSHVNDDNSYPIPLVADLKFKGLSSDILMIRHHGGDSFAKTITYIDFQKNVSEANNLVNVTQSGGALVDEITYMPMVSSDANYGLGLSSDNYSSNDAVTYPRVEIKQIPSNLVVTKLKNTAAGITKYQDFKYNGYLVDVSGSGAMGFKKTARSAWYLNASDKKTWSVIEIDPLMRGANKLSYITQPNSIPFSFPTDFSTGLLRKTENLFNQSIDPVSKKYTILLQNQKQTDFLTNIIKETIYNTYSSDYLLPTKVTNNNYLGTTLQGTTITEKSFNTDTSGIGSNYYIGRPYQTTMTSTAYGNTKKALQTLFYVNGNVSQSNKNVYLPDNVTLDPVTVVEKMTYYPNGLLKDNESSATGTTAVNQVAPRKVAYTYDATNRFVSTTTDTENLVSTNLTFHPLYGTVLTQKNPFNQVTTSVYDNWGKTTKVTDFLGKSINYGYFRNSGIYRSTQTGDDGSSSFVESDVLARQIKKGAKDINSNWIYVTTEYDNYNRVVRTSEPYLASSAPSQWTTNTYDDYSRPLSITAYTSKVVTNTYTGLTVVTNDNIMSKSKTLDANGQVVTTTDSPGGTINFKYDANYNLIESDYDGIKITTAYDNWGRQKEMVDTSAGIYSYTYNAYGETLSEATPKGITTYTLSPVGKLLSKKIVGTTNANGAANDENTNITSTFTYDATNKWLTNLAVVNTYDGNSNYAYSYDATSRQLNKTVETLPFATFTKELTFDTFGRVNTELSKGEAHGKISTKTIKHNYQNGIDIELTDNTTNQSLWRTNSVDARGQFTTGYFGNGLNIKKDYDNFGFLTNSRYYKITEDGGTHVEDGGLVVNNETETDVMVIANQFEPIKGNLLYRSNSLFASDETLEYDNQDRLKKWTSTPAEVINYNFNTPNNTQGFTGVNGGTVAIFLSRLRINTTLAQAGAQKIIESNSHTGNKYKIQVKVIKNSVDKVRVVAVEENNATGAFTYTVLGLANEGLFLSDYVAQNADAKLYIRFDKSENSTDIGVSKFFWIDDLVISKYGIETQSYDDRGKITGNSLGQYQYTNTAKPYQNTSITVSAEANSYYQTKSLQEISYTAFKAPIEIVEPNIDRITFGYNAMEERNIMYYGSATADKMSRPFRRYYSADGSMEITATFTTGNTTTPASVEFITYAGGDAYSAPVVVKSNGTQQNYFYLQRDYQGTIIAITDANANIVEKRLFDVWGAIIKVQDGANNNLTKLTFFDRGYTGHEHLQRVGLINMNARLYDPKLHRFLSPDKFVQDPYNTQNYNRYGYCVNNPTKYTDISGNTFNVATLAGCIPVIGSIFSSLLMHQNLDWGRVAVDVVMTGISIAVTAGIGTACLTITNFYSRAVVSALAHGVFQGTMSAATGGKFWAGFAAGALSSIASSLWMGGTDTVKNPITGKMDPVFGTGMKGIGGKFADNIVGTLSFAAVMGGAGSAIGGGNFWQGATTGIIVAGFNHLMHGGDQVDGIDPPTKGGTLKNNELTNSDGLTLDEYNKLPLLERMFSNRPGVLGGAGAFEYIEGSPVKGAQWLAKMGRKYGPETIATVEKVGSKYWKYSAEVAGRNGRTVYTKYLNMEGKTVQWFHDTYNASNKFLHREFNAAGGRLKVLWDGTREYIRKF